MTSIKIHVSFELFIARALCSFAARGMQRRTHHLFGLIWTTPSEGTEMQNIIASDLLSPWCLLAPPENDQH